ncbi:hypothetical protein scyTo_0017142 [Scyliorhinus torazame]|uniref:Insulin-like domain-containing protein n=1 Tax=Scyliorhinus torazame TaxID=75743 RepID=A0A401Q4N1_SCYTO|nr:hypothetical protein [Scyliorhinus torazame]
MKSLVFILVVGLTLSSSTRESIHNGRFTKLCGFDYLGEIHQICGSWPWKRFSPGLHGSSADDGVKRRRKDQWGYDHAGFQRFESDSDQGLFNNDDNQQVEETTSYWERHRAISYGGAECLRHDITGDTPCPGYRHLLKTC